MEERQLAAILFTDIIGYTALMQQDEQRAVGIARHYITVLKEQVSLHGGIVMNDYGDGSLCTFNSATQAVNCAIEVQRRLQEPPSVPLRIGLHIGEIIVEDGKVFGDGVNIASRIQSLGQANSVLFSREIVDKLRNQPKFQTVSLGFFEFKNVDEPMEVFALAIEGLTVPPLASLTGKLKPKKKDPSSSRVRKGIIALIVLALLGGLFMIYRFAISNKGRDTWGKSIAIIPFTKTSNTIDDLGEGLVDDILVHLSRIKELTKVISNRSSSKYGNSQKSPMEIGTELQVSSLVVGNIQQLGDSIKVSAQLIDTRSGNIIWANSFMRNRSQLFDLETEVAGAIVNALKAKLTAVEEKSLAQHSTENIEAYKLYRKGRFYFDKRTKESFDSAEANYKRALELDPDYTLAYAGLADCYTYNQQGLPQVVAVPIGRNYALKALSLDSNLCEALTTLGWIQGAFDYNWKLSKATLERAIELNPNYSLAHVYYGNLLQYTRENTEEGLKEVKKALELDPLSLSLNWILGRNYWLARKFDLAYTQLHKTRALDRNYQLTSSSLVFVDLELKKFKEAFDLIKEMPLRPGAGRYDYQGPYLCNAYAAIGDTVRARKELEKTMAEDPDQSPFHLARCYVTLGNYEKAFDELERAYEQRDVRIYNFMNVEPVFDRVREYPRFKALLKKTGFL